MQSATVNTSTSNNLPTPKLPKLPFQGLLLPVVLLVIGLGVGILGGSMFLKGAVKSSKNVADNKVFTGPVSYLAPFEGTLVAKDAGTITLEKDGSRLVISVDEQAQVIYPYNYTPGLSTPPAAPKRVLDMEIGSSLSGSVVLSPEFIAGDKNGEVRGTVFLNPQK